MYLSGDDKILRGKKGTSGVHVMKTVQAYIVSVYHEPIVAEQVRVQLVARIRIIIIFVSVRHNYRETGRVSHQRGILN